MKSQSNMCYVLFDYDWSSDQRAFFHASDDRFLFVPLPATATWHRGECSRGTSKPIPTKVGRSSYIQWGRQERKVNPQTVFKQTTSDIGELIWITLQLPSPSRPHHHRLNNRSYNFDSQTKVTIKRASKALYLHKITIPKVMNNSVTDLSILLHKHFFSTINA